MDPISAYVQLNIRIMPLDRGELFEDPLGEALEENEFGEVTGGGTMQTSEGEIDYCGIDLDLVDPKESIPFVCNFLTERGAPRGSKLTYEWEGDQREVPFGLAQGLGIYLNGTDLPAEVYRDCDVNELYDEINRLLGDRGTILGHWEGPTETALYLYGNSVDEMHGLIRDHMAGYPLCQRARVVVIA